MNTKECPNEVNTADGIENNPLYLAGVSLLWSRCLRTSASGSTRRLRSIECSDVHEMSRLRFWTVVYKAYYQP